jgi:hypothetical protein
MAGLDHLPLERDASGSQPAAKRARVSKRVTDAPVLDSLLSGAQVPGVNSRTFLGTDVRNVSTLQQSLIPLCAAEALRLNAFQPQTFELHCVGQPCDLTQQHRFAEQPQLHFQRNHTGGGDTCIHDEAPSGKSVYKGQVLKFEAKGLVPGPDVRLHACLQYTPCKLHWHCC